MASTASPAKRAPGASRRRPSGRYEQFISGELTVEDLDQEELLRGQLRDVHGSFQGRPPLMIPRSFHQKLTQELLTRAEGTIRENFDQAIAVFIEVMNNPRVRPQDRLYAAQYVWERMAGKIPEKQVVEASIKKWEDVAEAVFVDVYDDIQDAVVVSDEMEPAPVKMGVSWDDEEEVPAIEAPRPKPKPRRPTKKAS